MLTSLRLQSSLCSVFRDINKKLSSCCGLCIPPIQNSASSALITFSHLKYELNVNSPNLFSFKIPQSREDDPYLAFAISNLKISVRITSIDDSCQVGKNSAIASF